MLKIEIIYEDKDIAVIYKPAGLATQTARVCEADVNSQLRSLWKGGYVGMVHRLDQPVEGLLVFGKNKKATAGLAAQLTGGGLGKEYYVAVCGGEVLGEERFLDYLKKDEKGGVRVTDPGDREGKRAVLTYWHLGSRRLSASQSQIHLLRVELETGRLHQIRAQLAHHGLPLVGDDRYGTEESRQAGRQLGIRQTALCAYRLAFRHPISGRKLEWETEPRMELLRRLLLEGREGDVRVYG